MNRKVINPALHTQQDCHQRGDSAFFCPEALSGGLRWRGEVLDVLFQDPVWGQPWGCRLRGDSWTVSFLVPNHPILACPLLWEGLWMYWLKCIWFWTDKILFWTHLELFGWPQNSLVSLGSFRLIPKMSHQNTWDLASGWLNTTFARTFEDIKANPLLYPLLPLKSVCYILMGNFLASFLR